MSGRMRIEGNGSVAGTRLVMPDGTPVPGVMSVEWDMLPYGVEVRVKLRDVEVSLVPARPAQPAPTASVPLVRHRQS